MEKRYRRQYTGEQVVTNVPDENKLIRINEWVPKTSTYEHGGAAIVVGNGTSRLQFPHIGALVKYNASRLGDVNKYHMTSYGCNGLYKHASPDFLVLTSHKIAKDVIDSGYVEQGGTVVTRPHISKIYPMQMHLIPNDPQFNAGNTALYLACFDGHTTVYFIGFDNQTLPGRNDNVYAGHPGYNADYVTVDDSKWITEVVEVMEAYKDVDFVRIVPSIGFPTPPQWSDTPNYSEVSLKEFLKTHDVGLA